MGRDFAERYPAARRVFEEADDALGFALSRLCFEGPAEELTATANAQPAIVTVSVAVLRMLEEKGLAPQVVAGHSLGEYSALVAAGSLTLGDAVRLVRQRGGFMQEAVPRGVGAMAAILGLGRPDVDRICAEAAQEQVVSPANLNGPGQIVISGHAEAVARAVDIAKQRGAMKAIPLEVSAPFHCALMLPAARRLAAVLAETTFRDLSVPLISNVDAAPLRRGAEARDALERQVTAPVRWEESVQAMVPLGVTRALEVGPGKVLAGLVKRIEKGIRCSSTATVEATGALEEMRA